MAGECSSTFLKKLGCIFSYVFLDGVPFFLKKEEQFPVYFFCGTGIFSAAVTKYLNPITNSVNTKNCHRDPPLSKCLYIDMIDFERNVFAFSTYR